MAGWSKVNPEASVSHCAVIRSHTPASHVLPVWTMASAE